MSEIRRLQADEWQVLRETRLRALADSPLAFGRTYAQEIEMPDAEWRERCEFWACFVATDESGVVGISAGTWFDTVAPELHCMWIAPAHRGSGLGRPPAEVVIDWARSEPAAELRLHVAADNDLAMHFYEKLGFERTGGSMNLGSRPDVLAYELAMSLHKHESR